MVLWHGRCAEGHVHLALYSVSAMRAWGGPVWVGLMGALLCCARDLKLDNTLLTDGNPPMIKLCDFGFAKRWENNEEANMHTHIG